jgi:hypothetical protein
MRLSTGWSFGLSFGLGLWLASCGGSAPCGPQTCSGCCDSAGECLKGTAVFECGAGGLACVACQPNEACGAGSCQAFADGDYDASFPERRDAAINFDAGTFDAGPPIIDAGRPDAGAIDAGFIDAGRVDSGMVGDAGRADAGPPVSFMNDVSPIFASNCSVCHPSRPEYANARARVVPFNPLGSLIYQKITGTQSSGGSMPPSGQLSVADPAATLTIQRWILQGALNN